MVYDGWWDLEATDADSIEHALDMIAFGISLLAFSFDAEVSWRLKYKMQESTPGCATPSEDDLQLLDRVLTGFPEGSEAYVLAAAIDWYNRGRASRNVFLAFLCYYISIESVAIAVSDDRASFDLTYIRPDRGERRANRQECIEEKYEQFWNENKEEFIRSAYFDRILCPSSGR